VSTSNRSPFEQCALTSGLLNEEQLAEARKTVRWSGGDEPDAAAAPSDQQLADRLVDMGRLNAWQAKQLLEGRTKFNLGPYWIVDSIGQGGMGQVFKAEHSVLGRVVAIKVLPRAKSTPEAVTNFTNEVRALARLDHDKLVRAIDAGHDGNVYFLVIEYVPGADLRKLVRRDGPLSMEQAALVISQVAQGLQHAHAQGIVHRDVKPGNVLVTPEWEAKLSDLGLAGPLGGDAEKDPRFGKIVGTADYISPDHITSPWEPVPAWDIYSLGCTLYYAVTGKVPFPGGSTADKARAHCDLRPLDPRRLNPDLSAEFVDVMADMMAKDPAQRIPSAADVIARLQPWLPHPAPPPTREPRPPIPPMPPRVASMPMARPILLRSLATPPSVVPPVATSPPVATPPPRVVPPPIRSASAPAAPASAGSADLPDADSDSDDSTSLVLQTSGPPPGATGVPPEPHSGQMPNASVPIWRRLLDQRNVAWALLAIAALAIGGLVWWIVVLLSTGE
jgi:serine/threonine protein kinase